MAMAKVLNDCSDPGRRRASRSSTAFRRPRSGSTSSCRARTREQRDQLVIVELKQWETAKKTDEGRDRAHSVRRRRGGHQPSVVPGWSYASLLRNFNEAVYESDLELRPCAYLHNYGGDGAITRPVLRGVPRAGTGVPEGRGRSGAKLREFIRQHVRHGDRGQHPLPDRERADPAVQGPGGRVSSACWTGKQEFVLVDDQKVVYETALAHRAGGGGDGQEAGGDRRRRAGHGQVGGGDQPAGGAHGQRGWSRST